MTRREPSSSPVGLYMHAAASRQPTAEAAATAARQQRQEYTPEQFTQPFCDFMTENPTSFHVVDYCKSRLHNAGFQELPSGELWTGKIRPGGKYWTSRNGSAIIAFAIGRAYKPGDGVAMIAGHIDAKTVKLKPVSAKPANATACLQLGVAPHANGLDPTWWDRDLGLAGRVVVRDPDTGGTTARLVRLGWPIATHLSPGGRSETTTPIIGLSSAYSAGEQRPLGSPGEFVHGQPPELVQLVAGELGVSYAQIVRWDLELYDFQPARALGLRRELITAGGLEGRLCSWAAMMGLLAAEEHDDDDVDGGGYVRMVGLLDDVEIGGNGSAFLPTAVERMVESLAGDAGQTPGLLGRTYARSFLVAGEVAYAGHPDLVDSEGCAPRLNTGVAVKHDPDGGTDAAVLTRVAELVGARVQPYQARVGVGPVLSSVMGCRAAEAGIVQLGVHSVRATTGALDPGLGVLFYKGFLENWHRIDGEFAS
ncbi:Peptidase M18 [Cordyceps fumosorosea ARSEF 2679]|uniref:Peptidase M18 n=1 Tax=Cordyceps fumosorosea (strain ARSEF 2679) TaxID=1081104 RepID=A0A167M3U3_CORFA|nr:Peptidase M18 [Cordyceps fumosorosea ARSEF 2679]OAA53887.1 Peptidase M18 [Cordyceps fumosorosea ARSEF 2679]